MADDDGFLICFVRGGISADASGEFARAGDHFWWRDEDGDESREEFRARAEREARAAGETRIVFGGLPQCSY